MSFLEVALDASLLLVVAACAALRQRLRPPAADLPHILDLATPFAVDIGGSLTKLVFFVPDAPLRAVALTRAAAKSARAAGELSARLAANDRIAAFMLSRERFGRTGVRDPQLALHLPRSCGGTFHFVRFETRRMEGAMQLAQQNGLNAGMHALCATGGGAHKFRELALNMLGVDLRARDEIACLVKGMAFIMAEEGNSPGGKPEAFTFEGRAIADRARTGGLQYPFLLVNVGSGVSFICVEREGQWRRVGGTSIGGGTFYGLCHMLTGVSEFDAMLDLAEQGNNERVDLTVGDIYGGDYPRIGLKASTIASSFGKAIAHQAPPPLPHAPAPIEASLAGAPARTGVVPVASGSRAASGPFSTPSSPLLAPAADSGGAGGGSVGGISLAAAFNETVSASGRDTPSATGPAIDGEEDGSYRAVRGPGPRRSAAYSVGTAAALGLSPGRLGVTHGESADGPAGAASPRKPAPAPDAKPATSDGGNTSAASAAPPSSQQRQFENKDVSLALLIMISNNIGQLASLHAEQNHCHDIYFAGNFLRHDNTAAMRVLASSVRFWTKGKMDGLFLKHEGYCGALGAFLETMELAAAEDTAVDSS
jgi:type II pantothenate kinase